METTREKFYLINWLYIVEVAREHGNKLHKCLQFIQVVQGTVSFKRPDSGLLQMLGLRLLVFFLLFLQCLVQKLAQAMFLQKTHIVDLGKTKAGNRDRGSEQ